MCGQTGLLVGNASQFLEDQSQYLRLFTRMLCLSEHRGPDATGAAWLDAGGRLRVCKAPIAASQFTRSPTYRAWRNSVSPSTYLLMGHTRLPTQGSHLHRRNNHPLVDRREFPVVLTHNGNFPGANRYFRHFGLKRRWEVDSELLVRLARRHAGVEGIDLPALLKDIGQCQGHLAAVLAWAAKPGVVILLRRDRPLFLAWQERRRLLAYASERSILGDAISGEAGWMIQGVSTNTALVIDVSRMPHHEVYDFE